MYLEYVSGGSIRNLLREYGSFEEDVIRSYVAQIINGLAFLHGRNTLHRLFIVIILPDNCQHANQKVHFIIGLQGY